MRRLIKIALVVLGIRWFLHWRKQRREAAQLEAAPAGVAADPADELRQKLAASRAESVSAEQAAPEASVEDRRTEVHEQGRAALDDMTSSDEG